MRLTQLYINIIICNITFEPTTQKTLEAAAKIFFASINTALIQYVISRAHAS